MTARIGLIDSGIAASQAHAVVDGRSFATDPAGSVIQQAPTWDRLDHGSIVAAIILNAAPRIALLNAQAFQGRATTPGAVAAALRWLVDAGARVINLSFGLREDRAVLREACEFANARDVLLIAALPARGGPVFPAAYPGVLRVCGDARCAPGELSALPEGPAHLGACPRVPGESATQGGASLGTAHVTAIVAAYLQDEPTASRAAIMQQLESRCRFRGRERRSS